MRSSCARGFAPLVWASAALFSACADSGASVVILHNQVPGAGCVIGDDPNAPYRGRGLIDTAETSGYLFTPVVQSRAQEIKGDPGARLIQLQGAEVELETQPGLLASTRPWPKFTSRFSGSVSPGGTSGLAFTVLNKEHLADLAATGLLSPVQRATVIAHIVVFGVMDDQDVESEPFQYPIEVCAGCLAYDRGPCSALPSGFKGLTGGQCNLLQDEAVDCCSTDAGDYLCPAVTPAQ
jgi:hypothetical protein